MIKIYYHIYLIEGVDLIISEQLNLISKFIKEPYILNIGVSIPLENKLEYNFLINLLNTYEINYVIRNVENGGDEMTTLSILENDKDILNENDFILYIHTKGASKQYKYKTLNYYSWRHLMNYFNIEKYKLAIDTLQKLDFNTYGVLLDNYEGHIIYSGNFWWASGSYVKSINTSIYKRENRNFPQFYFLQSGINWKPFSPYNRKNENHYLIKFDRREYEIGNQKNII